MPASPRRSPGRTAGIVLSTLVVAVMALDAALQFASAPPILAAMQASGFAPEMAPRLAVVTALCTLLYAIPRTAVLGAILLSAFYGGAIAVHFRIGEVGSPPQLVCLLLGIAAWGGLWLRMPALRRLLPRVGGAGGQADDALPAGRGVVRA